MLTIRLPWEDAFGALIFRRRLATIASLSQSDPGWISPLVNTGCGEDVTIKEWAKLVWMEPRTIHWLAGGFVLEGKGMIFHQGAGFFDD